MSSSPPDTTLCMLDTYCRRCPSLDPCPLPVPVATGVQPLPHHEERPAPRRSCNDITGCPATPAHLHFLHIPGLNNDNSVPDRRLLSASPLPAPHSTDTLLSL